MDHHLKEIQNQVFQLRPVLAEITAQFSALSLADYVKGQWQVGKGCADEIFLSVLEKEAEKIYGKPLAQAISSQLRNKALVSSIDHLGIWNHPIFVNSDLVYSLALAPQELGIILATESVSLNNTSSWSGSLLYHNQQLKQERYSFFSDRKKTLPVFAAPAISLEDYRRCQKASGGLLDGLFNDIGIQNQLSAENFSIQACRLSFNFWHQVFPSAPELVYLPLETIISQYLLKIFEKPDDFLSRLILTEAGRRLWKEIFKDEHTFMFWGIDSKGRRQVLAKLPANAGELMRLIKSRQLYSASPLCFVVLLCVGLSCAGGFTQTSWLTEVKDKLLKLLIGMGMSGGKEFSLVQAVPTKNFAESSLAWLGIHGQYFIPTGVDLFLAGRNYYPIYQKLAEQLGLGESLQLMLPTIYSVVVPKHEQKFTALADLQASVFEALQMPQRLEQSGLIMS